jgi:hypothetical protein
MSVSCVYRGLLSFYIPWRFSLLLKKASGGGVKRWIHEFPKGAALFFHFVFWIRIENQNFDVSSPCHSVTCTESRHKLLYPSSHVAKRLTKSFELRYMRHSARHIDCVLGNLIWFIFWLFDQAALTTGITRFEVLAT